MSDIDFQNGFIVGMATRGITRSGLMYAPVCWNDSGVFSYFYIDFKKPVSDFSLGMLSESIVVHDSSQIPTTMQERISASVFKIYADILNRNHGITVLNKITSYLSFTDGSRIPPFSVHFYVAGIDSYNRLKYCFDWLTSFDIAAEAQEDCAVELPPHINYDFGIESVSRGEFSPGTFVENTHSVILT